MGQRGVSTSGEQTAMGQQHALGLAGRARCIHEQAIRRVAHRLQYRVVITSKPLRRNLNSLRRARQLLRSLGHNLGCLCINKQKRSLGVFKDI